MGIGGISLSADGRELYVMNIFDNSLYVLNLSTFNTTNNKNDITLKSGPHALPNLNCTNGTQRSWAVKFYKNNVYVGSVCDASSGTKSNLRAAVLQFNTSTNTFAANPIFEFPLTYPKGYPDKGQNNIDRTGWYPWTDDFNAKVGNGFGFIQGIEGFFLVHPEPIFSDIEFDIDGSMVLAFNDRTGMQGGFRNYGLTADPTKDYTGLVGGDILRAYFSNGAFILENAAKAGPATGYGNTNNQGPGFGEFYNDDSGVNLSNDLYHTEIGLGGIAIRPGSGEVVNTVMDPLGVNTAYDFVPWAGGIRKSNNTTGLVNDAFVVYRTPDTYSNGSLINDGTFGKAAGLGDITLACDDVSYLEIGNYVWEDLNKDGIQQACEPPISGVKVTLFTAAGVKVSTKTTDARGEYYFNQSDGLLPNTNYIIVFGTDGSTDQFSGGKLNVNSKSYSLTVNNTGQGDNKDFNDSDADPNALSTAVGSIPANLPKINLTSGSFGKVNHTYDVGFWTCYLTLSATGTSVCQGSTIQLSAIQTGAVGNVSYSWAGPASFSSNVANPTRVGALPSMAGTYSVTATDANGCTASATVSLSIAAIDPAPVGSNVCEGATISLSASGGGTYSWAGPATFSNTSAAPTRANATTAMAGVYSVTVTGTNSCTNSATTSVVVRPKPVINPQGDDVCEGATISLSASGGGAYSWAGPATFSNTSAAPTRANATTAMAGVYSVTVTGTNSCTNSATTSVVVRTKPVINPQGDDVCEGATISLSASGGGTYSWAGPAAFSATIANPTRSAASTAMAGVYSVTVTGTNSCTNSATTSVVVRTKPVINPQGDDVCEGATISLSASGGGAYSWAGPATFSNTSAAPTRANATTAMAGVYSVTVTGTNSCTNSATSSVVVRTKPVVQATTTPVCQGTTLSLSATGGGSYSWTGPVSFTSSIANPTRANATPAMSGVYSVTVTGTNSCTNSATVSATVNPTPAIVVISNTPVCEGTTISLSASGGATYSWTGPAGFSSTESTPTRSLATTAMSGIYSVTVLSTAGCSATATTSVVVNIQGASASASSPVCEKATISLSASNGGSTYSWAGPANFSSSLLNPTRSNATTAMSGIYSVTVIGSNSCTGTATTSVEVRTNPVVTANSNATSSTICDASTLNLSATGGTSYSWAGPNNFGSTAQNPSISSVVLASAGVYTVTVTGSNTCSNTGTVSVGVKECFGSLGDYVWRDTDKDGIQDASETGVKDVKVILLRETSPGVFTEVATQLTDATGKYTFDNLKLGNYKVQFTTLPADLKITLQNQGGDDTADSDADPLTAESQVVTIDHRASGLLKDNPTIDAGLVCIDPTFTLTATPATCGDYVAKSDAKISLSNVANGSRFDFNAGSTYTGNKTFATATAIPGGGVLANELPNPSGNSQTYTVRVFNQEGCFTDKTVTLTKTLCECPPPKCVPFVIVKLK